MNRSSDSALRIAHVLIGMLALVGIREPLMAQSPKSVTPQAQNATLRPTALHSEESGSKTKAGTRKGEDGLSPETKKKMREMFALNAAAGMREQKNPIRVDIVGDNRDVLQFQLPWMNERLANELIRDLGKGDANFWNGIRLMDFSHIIFSGENFKKVVPRKEIIAQSQDYDKYLEEFLKALKHLQIAANAMGTT